MKPIIFLSSVLFLFPDVALAGGEEEAGNYRGESKAEINRQLVILEKLVKERGIEIQRIHMQAKLQREQHKKDMDILMKSLAME
jgi:hypothetical protein